MSDKTGFIGLISDKNKLSAAFSKESTTGQLGFSVLNDYFSERLFPGISTLMPNLVYCYLIFSLIWGQEPQTDEELNAKLHTITTYKVDDSKPLTGTNKGFHGKVQENIVGTYRAFMSRYGFYEIDKNTKFGKLNEAYAGYKSGKVQSRYNEVQKVIKGEKNATIPANLQSYEIRDMIKRCLIVSGIEYEEEDKKTIFTPAQEHSGMSLFDLAVIKLACKKDKKDACKYIIGSSKEKIPGFEEMGKLFDANQYPELRKYYDTARFASIMQFYIKCRSNQLIRSAKRSLQGEKPEQEKDVAEKIGLKTKIENSSNENLLSTIEDREDCKKKMEILWNIYSNLKDGKSTDELIWKIIRDNDPDETTDWNRGETTEYLDTYRWEYRPGEKEKKDTEENTSNENCVFSREAGTNTKCASYFIRELQGNG